MKPLVITKRLTIRKLANNSQQIKKYVLWLTTRTKRKQKHSKKHLK